METEISPVKKKLMALLNNVHDLITYSHNRKDAKLVMESFERYAKNASHPIPKDKVEIFYDILLDSRANTLSYLLTEIAKKVMQD